MSRRHHGVRNAFVSLCRIHGGLFVTIVLAFCSALFSHGVSAQERLVAASSLQATAAIKGKVTVRVRLDGTTSIVERSVIFRLVEDNQTQTSITDSKGNASAIFDAGNHARTFSITAQLVSTHDLNLDNPDGDGGGDGAGNGGGNVIGLLAVAAPAGGVVFTVIVGGGADAAQARAQSALRSFASLGRIGLDGALVQFKNLQTRIIDRRNGGAGGVTLYGASLDNGTETLSGSALQSLVSSLTGGEGDGRNIALDSLGRWGVFVNGQGSFGTKDTTPNENGYHAKTGGLTIGSDYRITENFVLGGALGLLSTRSDFNSDLGNTKTKGFSFSLFGTYYHKNGYYIDSIASLGYNFYDTERNVEDGVATADTKGRQGGVSITSGYSIDRGPLQFGPYVRTNYLRVKVNELNESGSVVAGMHADRQAITSFTTDLGVQASYAISTRFGVISPNVKIEYEHQFRDDSRFMTGSLLADPLQTVYAVATDDPDRNYFNIGLGVSAQLAHGRAAFISYEGVLGRSTVTNNAVTAGIRLEF